MLKPAFQDACRAAVEELAAETAAAGPAWSSARPGSTTASSTTPSPCSTAARIAALRYKVDLPNYGVFDEKRVFAPGPMPGPVNFRGVRLGLPICEDIWGEEVVECLAETGAEILIVPNGSPYWREKADDRLNVAVARVAERPAARLCQPGRRPGRAGLRRRLVRPERRPLARVPDAAFHETVVTTAGRRAGAPGAAWTAQGFRARRRAGRLDACVLGLRDYVNKNGFPGVVLGLSGGIDSALVRGDGGRCAWGRARPLRHAALPLHLADDRLEDAAEMRQGAGRALRHRADRAAGGRLRAGAEAGRSPAASATSPRRTCRRAPAAPS